MDFCPQSQLEILSLLRSGVLCRHQRFVALLLGIHRASVAGACDVLDFDNSHRIATVSKQFLFGGVTRSARHGAGQLTRGNTVFAVLDSGV